MKTRSDLYSKEATELLRVVSEYKTLLAGQLYRLFPGKEAVITNLLTYMVKQGRIIYNPHAERYSANEDYDANPDLGMIAAFWVLLDFLEKIEYHFASDFPVKLSFFADCELYEVIHVPYGQEMVISQVLKKLPEEASRRIILIEDQEQISGINIANTAGFCTVDTDGSVHYYKLE